MHVEIDADRKTAKLVAEYFNPIGLQSGAMGGLQQLRSGNVLTAWGTNPVFTEFKAGKAVWNVQVGTLGAWGTPTGMYVYRAYKMDWVGRPAWPPSIVAVKSPGLGNSTRNSTVYVSWNGATEVKSWVVVSVPFYRQGQLGRPAPECDTDSGLMNW
jgi:hypothetical protein